jgi:integrase
MAKMEPRWDESSKRWECSIGSGKNRTWFRTKIQGEEGREAVIEKRRKFLDGPKPLRPGSIEEFIETVWWPRIKPKCTAETLRNYRHILDHHISRFYGRPIDQIRVEDLQPWVSNIDRSPKTVQNIYGVMSGILELAHKTGRYRSFDHKLVSLPSVVKEKVKGLEMEKIKRVVEASKGTVLEGPVWVAAYLGLRRNEVCGLKVPHVEIRDTEAILTIQDNRQPCGETHKLKSKPEGQARVLHIPKWMGEKLLGFRTADSIYLFTAEGRPIHPMRITDGMEGLCRKAKVPRMRFHDLRHSCRTNLSEAGVPEVLIMELLGHTDYQASLGYQGERPQRQVEAFDKLAQL